MNYLYCFLIHLFILLPLNIFGQKERYKHEIYIDSLTSVKLYDECLEYINKNIEEVNKEFYLQYMYLCAIKDSVTNNLSTSILERYLTEDKSKNISDFTFQMAHMGLANYYHNNDNVENAIYWLEKGKNSFIKIYGTNNINICIYYAQLASYYQETNDTENFIKYTEDAYSICKKLGYRLNSFDEALFNLAIYYRICNQSDKAITCLLDLLDWYIIDDSEKNHIYAQLCSNYAIQNDTCEYAYYRNKLNITERAIQESIYQAEMYYLKNIKFIKNTEQEIMNIYGLNSYEYANYLGWRAFLQHEYLSSEICISYLNKAEKILSSIPSNQEYIELWLLISSQYDYHNFIEKAMNTILMIEKSVFNTNDVELIVNFLHQKANLFESLGDIKNSIKINNELLSIQKKYNDYFNEYDILITLDRIARQHFYDNQYKKTLNHYIISHNRRIQLYGDTLACRETFYNISECYLQLGEFDEALKYAEKCISYHENNENLNEKIPLFIHLGDCYLAKGDTIKSFQIFSIAKNLCNKTGSNGHFLKFRLRSSLIDYYAFIEDYNKVYELLLNQIQKEDSLANRELYHLEESERLHFWDANNDFHIAISKYANECSSNNKLQELAYNTLLNVKGKLLQVSKEINIPDRINADFKQKNLDCLKQNIDSNDVLIEFSEIYQDSTFYACIYQKDWDHPKVIELTLNSINIHPELMNSNYTKDIYIDIWKPIEQYINPGDHIYFSPSGILHQIPIESLPIGDGKVMSDVYHMHRVSSTRELALKKDTVKYTKAVLYGNLNYEMTDEEMLTESRLQQQADENYFVSRGLLEDSIRGYIWTELKNTEQEVNYISSLMNENHISTTTYQQNSGNEESFKALSGKGYNIIHLATHGFFYPDKEAQQKDYFRQTLLNTSTTYHPDFSMWRSGLVLSGGNRAWKGDSIPDQVEDGILKAQEISDLDLRGADLVVLSACQTGLGEITSDGVFGLQRAFKMAGAQTIVMSLTEVDDQTTMAMMNKFYSNLFSGQSKHDAFYNAQRYIRSIKPDPQYWAGWIMLD